MSDIKFKKKILFLGMPDMAMICFDKLAKAGVNIVGVVPPAKTSASYDYFVSFLEKYRPYIVSYNRSLKEPEFIEKIKNLDADLAVVCSYNKLFPKELLECTKDGFINCHPSLLPYYRGPNPYSHIILNNESQTGVTLHFMDEGFDTGDIIYQKEFDLQGNETMGTLFNITNQMFAEMLLEMLIHYEKKGKLQGYPQKHLKGSYANNIEPTNFENLIDWNGTAKEIDCFVRALNPFIVAISHFRDYVVKIMSGHYVDEVNSNFNSGAVCDITNGLGVATKKGIFYIDVLQYGTYLITTGDDFIKRFHLQIGESFY